MKRALKKKSNIYTYLDSTKVLEIGTDEAIDRAKQEYWRVYKAAWRRSQRKATKQYIIVFTEDEAKIIKAAAKQQMRSTSGYIKDSCLAYLNKKFIVPDKIAVGSIKALLAMNYDALKKLFDGNLVSYQTGIALIQQMSGLENAVLQQLNHPKSLEQWIEETVRNAPQYKEVLIELLQNIQVW